MESRGALGSPWVAECLESLFVWWLHWRLEVPGAERSGGKPPGRRDTMGAGVRIGKLAVVAVVVEEEEEEERRRGEPSRLLDHVDTCLIGADLRPRPLHHFRCRIASGNQLGPPVGRW